MIFPVEVFNDAAVLHDERRRVSWMALKHRRMKRVAVFTLRLRRMRSRPYGISQRITYYAFELSFL
jgi:hypothetical protein